MADFQSLDQLRDIHLPQVVGWWPLAPGWYVSIVLIIVLTIVFIYIGYRRYVNARPKKEALKLLWSYRKHYLLDKDSHHWGTQTSELLRRVALAYFPRVEVAGLQGNDWITFLNNTAKKLDFNEVSQLLLQLPYQPETSVDLDPLFDLVRAWIKQRGAPCLS